MIRFEGYDRRISKIQPVLEQYADALTGGEVELKV